MGLLSRDALELAIDEQVTPAAVLREDGGAGVVEHLLEANLALEQCALDRVAGQDVIHGSRPSWCGRPEYRQRISVPVRLLHG
jgi:hypothetical protein